jgi:hypothetical protein
MAKDTNNPPDRVRNDPEPGPPPGLRAEQRDTEEQLEQAEPSHDPAVDWEREEQEQLPPRGTGSQTNQAHDRQRRPQASMAKPDREAIPAPNREGEQSGGNRGPSNDNR